MVIVIMSSLDAPDGDSDPAVLTISEVSRRTGIPVAGLRNWEQRYGLPRPQRSASGRRRYREADCALLADVLRRRAGGLSLGAAMAQAVASAGENPEQSIFARLRRLHPGQRVHVLNKAVLAAVTKAIEDECCARAQRPVLLGSFQRQRFYQAAAPRWADLARTAEQTVIFADFERVRQLPGPLTEVPVSEKSPLRREWALVCDAPDHPACVAGWEHPGQDQRRDQDRVFEVLWSVDPQVVRSAARIGIGLAAAAAPELPGQLEARLSGEPGPSSADLRRASSLLERTLDYVASINRSEPRGAGQPG
jgi:MerR family transcriptional regulator, light-induced transcriptional regulator